MSDEFPDHITTMHSLAGDRVFRCQTCGQEGATLDELETTHHEQCPEKQ